MEGRREHERQIEQQTLNRITNNLVLRFYYSLDMCTPNSKKQYVSVVMEFINWYEEESIEIFDEDQAKLVTAENVHQYMDWVQRRRELEVSTLQRKIVTLNTFFKFLKRNKIISENPIDSYGRRMKDNSEKEVISLNAEEMKVIWNNIRNAKNTWQSKRDYCLIYLLFTTGLRVSAADEINLQDIDLQNHKIMVVEKLNKKRTINISSNTKDVLEDWIRERKEIMGCWADDVDALFVTKYNKSWKRLGVRAIQAIFKKYTKGIDKKVTPHKARSTYGTMLYQETGDIYLVAEVLGQSSVEATKRYIKTREDKKINVINKIAQNLEI